MEPLSFILSIQYLRTRFGKPLPGSSAHFTMAPLYRQDPALSDVRGKPCREAAVLALLYPLEEGVPAVILTERRDHLNKHAGQISFPGGRREPDESLLQTALRETHEEIGLPPETVDILGGLTPLYIPPSNFCVYPFVGVLPAPPILRLQDEEVAAILHAPLPLLLDPATRQREDRLLHGKTVIIPFFHVNGHKVWGATAMMLAELLALFEA